MKIEAIYDGLDVVHDWIMVSVFWLYKKSPQKFDKNNVFVYNLIRL